MSTLNKYSRYNQAIYILTDREAFFTKPEVSSLKAKIIHCTDPIRPQYCHN